MWNQRSKGWYQCNVSEWGVRSPPSPLLIFSLRCSSKAKSILEVPKSNLAFNPSSRSCYLLSVVWNKPFSSGIGFPLFITSRFDWKSSFQALARPLHWGRGTVCLPSAFSLRFFVRSARLNRFYKYVKYVTYSMDRKDIQYKCPQILQWWQTTRKQKACAQPS